MDLVQEDQRSIIFNERVCLKLKQCTRIYLKGGGGISSRNNFNLLWSLMLKSEVILSLFCFYNSFRKKTSSVCLVQLMSHASARASGMRHCTKLGRKLSICWFPMSPRLKINCPICARKCCQKKWISMDLALII